MWYIGDNGLYNDETPTAPTGVAVKPYPLALWRIDEKYGLTNMLMPHFDERKGAFMNAVNLENVRIPETVKKIGEYSFAGTKLKKIKISADCEYFPTSFPEGCEVEFYGQT